jgi:hypothetical protein
LHDFSQIALSVIQRATGVKPLKPKRNRVTPAMEAGVTDHGWTLDEVIALL